MAGKAFVSSVLSLCVLTVPATPALADMWVCPQRDGTNLFSDRGGPGCRKMGGKKSGEAPTSPAPSAPGSAPSPSPPAAAPTASAGDYFSGLAAHQRRDYASALAHLRPAAERGSIEAQLLLGSMYEHGQGVPRNPAEAFRWYRMAADKGSSRGQVHVGHMFNSGRGVAQDHTEAFRYLRLAAEQGHPGLLGLLAEMCLQGKGVPQDTDKAYKLWSLGAGQERNFSQVKLGRFHQARGTSQDNILAYMWFDIYVAHGGANASTARTEQAAVAKRMTPAEIAEAQKRAKEWKPRHLTEAELGDQIKMVLASATPLPPPPQTAMEPATPAEQVAQVPGSHPPAVEQTAPANSPQPQGPPGTHPPETVTAPTGEPAGSELDDFLSRYLEATENLPFVFAAILVGLWGYRVYTTRAKHCPYCHKELPGKGLVCPSCGQRRRFPV